MSTITDISSILKNNLREVMDSFIDSVLVGLLTYLIIVFVSTGVS